MALRVQVPPRLLTTEPLLETIMNLRAFMPGTGKAEGTPVLVFRPEELMHIHGMLRRSDWCCSVTRQMQEFLDLPEVVEYLETLEK